MRTLLASSLIALCMLGGCAYRRHTTPMQTVQNPKAAGGEQPPAMYTFRVLDAIVPQTRISGLAWDDDGSAPDVFVRLYVDGRLLWTSEVEHNQTRPEWNAVLPRNVVIGSNSLFRIELWDHDTAITADPLGFVQRHGLPETAVPDAIARLQLDNKSVVSVMVSAPRPHRGVGLSVEVREEALRVIAVKPYSPAYRAGIKVGDRIVGIGTERVQHMSDDDAVSELSLAADRNRKLVIADPGQGEREVTLDQGYLWLTM